VAKKKKQSGQSVPRDKSELERSGAQPLLDIILTHTHMLVAYLDKDFNFIKVNRAYAEADEKDPDFFPGKNHFDLYPNKDNEAIFAKVVKSGRPYRTFAKPFEYADHPERGVSYWDWSLIPEKDLQGKVHGLVLTLADVSEQIRNQEAMRKLERAVEQSPVSVVITDSEGSIEYVNPKFARLTGYSITEVIGKNPSVLKSGEHSADFYQNLWRTIKDGREWRGEFCNRKKNGDIYWESAQISPIKDESGRITHFVGVKEDITQKKQAEAALVESEEKFRILAEQSPSIIFIVQKNQIVYANERCREIMGYGVEELYAKEFDLRKLVAPESLDLGMANLVRHAKGEDVPPVEYRLLTKKGEKLDAILTTKLIQFRGEQAILGTVTDISERKAAEDKLREAHDELEKRVAERTENLVQEIEERKRLADALRESEYKYKSVIENANEAILVAQDDRIKLFNPKLLELTGYSEEDFASTSFIEFLHPEDRHIVMEKFNKRLKGWKDKAEYSVRFIDKAGRIRWIDIRSVMIEWEGRPASLSICTDITESREAEARLQEAEQNYRTIADFTYDWEYWEKPDGTFEWVSPSCERITGYRPEEFLENTRLREEIICREDQQAWLSHVRKVRENRLASGLQFRITDKTGQTKWIEHYSQPVVFEDGQFLGIRGSNRDITSRKQVEDEIDRIRQELSHTMRLSSMGELTASIAHELNQPLTSIMNNAQAALRFLDKDPRDIELIREILTDIVDDDHRAAEVIRGLRELVRKGAVDLVSVRVNDIAREVATLVRSAALIRDIKMDLDLEPDLPEVLGDRVQLQQVLLNLIMNGFEAMEKQSPENRRLTVRTRLEKGDQYLQVSVIDTGEGIREERLETIFQPFYSSKAGGMGMGLSINQTIISAFGGRMWAENNTRGGATISFILPLHGQAEN
jgi:PAS domain S-box-containing protein